MKKTFLIFLVSVCALGSIASAEPEGAKRTHLGYFLGSLRAPYSGIVSGLDFQSAVLDEFPLGIDARLQSRGTFFALNPTSFDLDLAALYRVADGDISFDAGLGYKLLARLSYDERSSATTAYAPFVRTKADFVVLRGDIDLDFKLTFDLSIYGDGLALSLRPRFVMGFSNFFVSLDAYGEMLARLWGSGRVPQDTGFFMDSFVTLGVRF